MNSDPNDPSASNRERIQGQLPEDKDRILDYFRIKSVEDVAAMLVHLPEEDKWSLLRDVILALRTEVAEDMDENPYARAIEYLYTLSRFVESAKRFPSKNEQGRLLEELWSKVPEKERLIDPMVTLINQASRTPRSRKATRQLKEMGRSYLSVVQVLPDSPKRYSNLPFDQEGFLPTSPETANADKLGKRAKDKRKGEPK